MKNITVILVVVVGVIIVGLVGRKRPPHGDDWKLETVYIDPLWEVKEK